MMTGIRQAGKTFKLVAIYLSNMLTKITLNKLTDTPVPGDRTPSHSIVAADENYQNKVTVGKLWLKKGERGNYLSGELSKPYTKEDGTILDGYVLISQKEYDLLKTPSIVDTGEALSINDVEF